jgi:hypothetical protein
MVVGRTGVHKGLPYGYVVNVVIGAVKRDGGHETLRYVRRFLLLIIAAMATVV